MRWFRREQPGAREAHVTSDASPRESNWDHRDAVGGDAMPWTAAQFGIGWLADTYVLGERGIEPKLPSDEARRAWSLYRPDPDGQLFVREFQRVALLSMLLDRDCFLLRDGGRLRPMPGPYEIHRDKATDLPVRYEWRPRGRPKIEAPASDVIHEFLRVRPGQRRGYDLYGLVEDIARERRQFVFDIIKLAKMAARLRIFHKRSGRPTIGAQARAAQTERTVEVDWTTDGLIEIGEKDDIVFPTMSSGPMPVLDVERAAGGAIGQPFGISRMQATRDYSDTAYSSARMASLTDAATWQRYQQPLLRITREAYRLWPGRLYFVLPEEPEWIIPRFPSIDPTKDAMVEKIYVELGVMSRQEVIRRHGGDPETTMREIEEWERRRQPAPRSAVEEAHDDTDPGQRRDD